MEWFSSLLKLLCPFCRQRIGTPDGACRECALELSEIEAARPLTQELDGLPVVAVTAYADWARELVLHNKTRASRVVVGWMARVLSSRLPAPWRQVPLAWVPGHAFGGAHLVERLALELALLGQPLVAQPVLVRRWLAGPAQKKLDSNRRRAREMKTRYGVTLSARRARASRRGGRVILLDDVVTTGATVRGCARLLAAEAGLVPIGALAFASVERRDGHLQRRSIQTP